VSRLEGKLLILLAVILAAVDTASKYRLNRINPKPRIIPGVFELTDHHNFGLVANIGVPRVLILIFTLALIVAMLNILLIKSAQLSRTQGAALALIIGGALGNFFDRLLHGFVYDWILLFNTSIINIADVLIGIGIGILLIENFRSKKSARIDTKDFSA